MWDSGPTHRGFTIARGCLGTPWHFLFGTKSPLWILIRNYLPYVGEQIKSMVKMSQNISVEEVRTTVVMEKRVASATLSSFPQFLEISHYSN